MKNKDIWIKLNKIGIYTYEELIKYVDENALDIGVFTK